MRYLKDGPFVVTSAARVRINRGGYDRHGAYWGDGAPLYRVTVEGPTLAGERFPLDFTVYARRHRRDDAMRDCLARAVTYFGSWHTEAPRELHA